MDVCMYVCIYVCMCVCTMYIELGLLRIQDIAYIYDVIHLHHMLDAFLFSSDRISSLPKLTRPRVLRAMRYQQASCTRHTPQKRGRKRKSIDLPATVTVAHFPSSISGSDSIYG